MTAERCQGNFSSGGWDQTSGSGRQGRRDPAERSGTGAYRSNHPGPGAGSIRAGSIGVGHRPSVSFPSSPACLRVEQSPASARTRFGRWHGSRRNGHGSGGWLRCCTTKDGRRGREGHEDSGLPSVGSWRVGRRVGQCGRGTSRGAHAPTHGRGATPAARLPARRVGDPAIDLGQGGFRDHDAGRWWSCPGPVPPFVSIDVLASGPPQAYVGPPR